MEEDKFSLKNLKEDMSHTNFKLLLTLLGLRNWNKVKTGAEGFRNGTMTPKRWEEIQNEVYDNLDWKANKTIEAEGLTDFGWNTNWKAIKTKLDGGKKEKRKTIKVMEKATQRQVKKVTKWYEPVIGFTQTGHVEKKEEKYKLTERGVQRICIYAILLADILA